MSSLQNNKEVTAAEVTYQVCNLLLVASKTRDSTRIIIQFVELPFWEYSLWYGV